MSHVSRFGRRCSIWRGFSDDSSCSGSVLDFSFKETMRHQSHFFVAATLFGGDGWWPLLPRPMQMYTGRFVCCDSDAAMRIKSWLRSVYSIILCNTACDMDTVVRV